MVARLVLACACTSLALPAAASDRVTLAPLIAQHAKAHGVPETLVHRIIQRESGYNPRALSRGNFGLMQIKYATAKGMGYTGPASGLLDANVNLTYGVPYLANAYRVAGGNADKAVSLYAGGYYYVAKRQGLLSEMRKGTSAAVTAEAAPAAETPSPAAWLRRMFTPAAPQNTEAAFAGQ